MAAKETTRGQRKIGGTVEEVILVDPDILNEVIIPTMAVNRRLPDGSYCPDEVINRSQSYITTAGYRDTFAYEKLKELLVQSVAEPDEAFVMGATIDVPLKEGLIDTDYIDNLKLSDTYKEESYQREIMSVWTGSAEDAFFPSDLLERCRTLKTAEIVCDEKGKSKGAYYIIGVDVGRLGCTTEAVVIKIIPQKTGADIKQIVNIYTYESEHFEEQAIHLKRLYYTYKARALAIDGNGLGVGLLDFMVKRQTDPLTWEELPPFDIINDENNIYKKYTRDGSEPDAIYIIKANAPMNTEMYSYCRTQLGAGKVRFLIDEMQAKSDILESRKQKEALSYNEMQDRLRPYVLTTILKEQMCNLIENSDGANIILKQQSRKIKKDKFSALIYGLYYIKMDEDKRKKRKRRDIKDMMFFG